MSAPSIGWNDHRDLVGLRIPRWLGVADYSWHSDRTLLLPIPLNYLWGLMLGLYLKVTVGFNAREQENKAYSRGFDEGLRFGKEIGRRNGIDEGFDRAVKAVMKMVPLEKERE